jgi:hypothetical protein
MWTLEFFKRGNMKKALVVLCLLFFVIGFVFSQGPFDSAESLQEYMVGIWKIKGQIFTHFPVSEMKSESWRPDLILMREDSDIEIYQEYKSNGTLLTSDGPDYWISSIWGVQSFKNISDEEVYYIHVVVDGGLEVNQYISPISEYEHIYVDVSLSHFDKNTLIQVAGVRERTTD